MPIWVRLLSPRGVAITALGETISALGEVLAQSK